LKNNSNRITKLKKEIEIKDFIIKELMQVITENKIKVPDTLLRSLILLYSSGEEKK